MSSYHTSFTYLNENSYNNYNLVISHFDNYDNGEIDSFLSVDPVYYESYNGTKRTLYGTKYNSVYTLDITVINKTLEEFSTSQTRSINRWLTGHQSYSWMDLYVGDDIKCRLHCYVKDVKPYKMDSRIIGFVITVESSSPWAYSPVIENTIPLIGYKELTIRCNSDEQYKYIPMNISFKRIAGRLMCFDPNDEVLEIRGEEIECSNSIVNFKNINVLYNNSTQIISLSKESTNEIKKLNIANYNTKDNMLINNISDKETITLSDNMIIQSSNSSRIFGDDFNYVWPKLQYGINMLDINGDGDLKLSYTMPMKVGDCIRYLEE